MNARVVIDNISKNNLKSEWGLAIFIEYNGKNILLDTGATGAFVDNTKAMGIDLADVDCGVLSHAHFDHSDGLEAFFNVNSKAPFYLREGSAENCYTKYFVFSKYIGIHKGWLDKYKERIVYAQGDMEISDGVYVIPHKTANLGILGKKAHMYRKEEGKWTVDDFKHEQSLVFETEKGLVIFNSCSHGGADNIITEISNTFKDKNIYAIIGGFHLFKSSEADVRALAKRIKDTGIKKVITGHCTGEKAFSILKEELGDSLEQLYTGMEIEF